jgi:hypothetical protein
MPLCNSSKNNLLYLFIFWFSNRLVAKYVTFISYTRRTLGTEQHKLVTLNPPVVLATERKQVARVRPVVANMSEDGAGCRQALPWLLLSDALVVVVADINERPFLLVVGDVAGPLRARQRCNRRLLSQR